MDQRLESRIEGWDSKPLTGGFAELRELADGGFSGVATTGGATLYMLNGRVVGVFGGSIDDFEDAQATVYKAPHPSVPLLFAMKEHGGEQQAKYYTNDTPISEAHNQLSDAGFTGYIELSENVLSGDYYVLYYGGRSLSCAFVGNSERLEVGDEAFALADDEVGIYEVMSVDVEVTDIPEAGGADGGQGAAGGAPAGGGQAAAGGSSQGGAEPRADAPSPPEEPGAGAEPGSAPDAAEQDAKAGARSDAGQMGEGQAAGRAGASEQAAEPAGPDPPAESHREADVDAGAEPADVGEPTTDRSAADAEAATGTAESTDAATSEPDAAATEGTSEPAEADAAEPDQAPRAEAAADRAVEAASGPQGSSATGAATASEGLPKSQANLGDLRAIPSLSPDKTAVAEPGQEAAVRDEGGADAATSGTSTSESAGGRSESTGVSGGSSVGADRTTSDERPGTDVAERASQAVDVDVEASTEPEPVPEDAGTDELRRQLAAREERIEELEAAITDLRVQRDGLTDERDRLEQEVSRLEQEVADLEAEIERLRGELDDGTRDKQQLTREEALTGTNLFVRYGSKGGGTLEDAHAGEVDKEEVNENLRLEHHTQFDTDEVVVDGRPFDEFLRNSIYRGFVEWVVEDLLYEIQDTGHVKGLRELYDAIPQIDRAELLGDVSVQFTEDGEQYREQRSFDVVLRDRMGNPLVVGNLNDSRNPANRDMMEAVIQNGTDVKGSNESLASAMMVTSSFFKPGALEAADEAHGGGILSGGSKESYVRLGRKLGFHLILVESRGGDFHVNVPEL